MFALDSWARGRWIILYNRTTFQMLGSSARFLNWSEGGGKSGLAKVEFLFDCGAAKYFSIYV